MTTSLTGTHLSFARTRQVRRQVAGYRIEGACTGSTVRVPWVAIALGIALLALTLLSVGLVVAVLV